MYQQPPGQHCIDMIIFIEDFTIDINAHCENTHTLSWIHAMGEKAIKIAEQLK